MSRYLLPWLLGLLLVSGGPLAQAQTTVEYIHTDALGSPVAVTNQAGQVIERLDYEPYGAIVGQPNYGGIGFTGHVQDAATGLTYMQQRYYDSGIGAMLSVDPVTALSNPVGYFHRYRYAANNPYKFTDPDGRCYTSTGECMTDEQFDQAWEGEAGRVLNAVGSPLGTVADVANGDFKGAIVGFALSRVPGGKAGAQAGMGVVYKRIDPKTLAAYIGKAKSFLRFLKRQGEHDRKLGVKHEYEVLGRAEPGKALSHLEETNIRAAGGIKSEGGPLENKIHAMSEKNFSGFQGVFRVEGRIDAKRLDKELSGK